MFGKEPRGKVARAAISAALTGVLAFGGVIAPVSTALADNTIEVTNAEGQTFDFYQVLTGTVTAEDVDGVTTYKPGNDVAYADGVETAIVGYLQGDGNAAYAAWYNARYEDNNITADGDAAYSQENVLAYITETIEADEAAGSALPAEAGAINDGKKAAAADSLAGQLAVAISGAAGVTAAGTDVAQIDNATSGYYLIIPHVEDGQTFDGKGAIWVANVGTETVNVTKKQAFPTLLKQAKEGEGEFTTFIDADQDDMITYQLTVTLPTVPEAGTSAKFKVTDTMAAGLELVSGTTPTVAAGENDAADLTVEQFAQTGQELTFTIDAQEGVDTYVITYQAKLKAYDASGTNDVTPGNATNNNTASLAYAPAGDFTDDSTLVETVETAARVATYQVSLVKQDFDDETAIENVQFAILNSDGEYLQSDGTFASTANWLVTNDSGELTLPYWFDADTYTLKENKLEGYESLGTFTFTITSELDEVGGTVTTLAASSDNDLVTVADDADVDAAAGTIKLTVKNKKAEITLPITGMKPSELVRLLGALMVGAGLVVYVRRRSTEDGSEA